MAASGFDDVVAILKSIAEPTRLRILDLLASGELNVKDLTRILGQSQPRISRHLRLLGDSGLIQRYREGNWVYCRLAGDGPAATLVAAVRELLPDDAPMLSRDRMRLDAVKRENSETARAFFNETAAEWDRIRTLQAGEAEIERAILESAGEGPFATMLDLGTGTGRMLEVFADRIGEGIGIDQSRPMLGFARARLERAGLDHCQVRLGDILHLPYGDASADLVVVHQVIHYFDDPVPVLAEAERVLRPGGRVLVVDFAPHELEFLRTDFAHRRLGFSRRQMASWLKDLDLVAGPASDIVRMGTTPEGNLTVTVWVADRAA